MTTKKTTGIATEVLVEEAGTKVRPTLRPRLVTTPTLEGSEVVDVINMIIGIGTEITTVGIETGIVAEGGALIATAIILLLATSTIPKEITRRVEGVTVAATMEIIGKIEEDMVAIVVGGVVGVATEAETGDTLNQEVGV